MKIKIFLMSLLFCVMFMACSSSSPGKDILSFSINDSIGTINATDITVIMPYGTDLTSLIPQITISSEATVSPASGVTQDFTNPLIYTVTASDGTTKLYTATVTVTVPSSKDILSFSILGSSGVISGTSISLNLPYGTDLSNLKPTIVINGASISPASGVAQNFTTTINYVVTALDSTTKTYTVAVSNKPVAGYSETFSAEGVNFILAFVPGGLTFPRLVDDTTSATVAGDYWIGETEVTYELWSAVYDWATTDTGGGTREDGGPLYSFANIGTIGSADAGDVTQPVTNVNWRDSMIFGNALTEWYNAKKGTSYIPVYYINSDFTTLIRASTNVASSCTTPGCQDEPYVKIDATGFRLAKLHEWSLAARYRGDNSGYGAIELPNGSGYYWSPGNYVSGATADCTDQIATELVAWTHAKPATQGVALLSPNTLGLYDMGGNAWEWNFDLAATNYRMSRGGSRSTASCGGLRIGAEGSLFPWYKEANGGFRLARTY